MTLTEAHVSIYQGITRELPDDATLVPDLMPLCFTTGLGWRVQKPPLAVLAFMGLDWQVLRQLRVGDTIRLRAKVVTKKEAGKPGRGLITVQRTVVNQRGEVVQEGETDLMVEKRP